MTTLREKLEQYDDDQLSSVGLMTAIAIALDLDRDAAVARAEQAEKERDEVRQHRDQLASLLATANTARWQAEREIALRERDGVRWDRDAAIARAERAEQATREWKSSAIETGKERDAAVARTEQTERERDEALTERDNWKDRAEQAEKEFEKAQRGWKAKYEGMYSLFYDVREERDAARRERDEALAKLADSRSEDR
jgi:hypothetical protein